MSSSRFFALTKFSLFDILGELFKCTEQALGNHSSHLTKAISSLLHDRSSKSSVRIDGVIDAFLNSVDDILVSADPPSSFEPAEDLCDLWDQPIGCITTVLNSIISVRNANLVFARKLVSRIDAYPEEMTAQSAFVIRCLGYMISKDELREPCASIVADLDLNRFEAGGEMHLCVQNCLKVSM